MRPLGRRWLIEGALLVRGICFLGRRHVCPCCGWQLRAFTKGGGSFRTRPAGYCPRCNSKARHRRVWLYLQERTDLMSESHQVLEVAPHVSLSRALSRRQNLSYLGVDLDVDVDVDGRRTVAGDLTRLPLQRGRLDVVICVHVLEHVVDDRAAMRELHRVLRPGGWALVNVPYDAANPTYEDPSVTTPSGRREAFGEAGHVRVYGSDLPERLTSVGFEVSVSPGPSVSVDAAARFGLTTDECIFLCMKPEVTTW